MTLDKLKPRTDDNGLADIRASSPYRAGYAMLLSEQPDSLNMAERKLEPDEILV
jgi:hypothetical protein